MTIESKVIRLIWLRFGVNKTFKQINLWRNVNGSNMGTKLIATGINWHVLPNQYSLWIVRERIRIYKQNSWNSIEDENCAKVVYWHRIHKQSKQQSEWSRSWRNVMCSGCCCKRFGIFYLLVKLYESTIPWAICSHFISFWLSECLIYIYLEYRHRCCGPTLDRSDSFLSGDPGECSTTYARNVNWFNAISFSFFVCRISLFDS